MPTRTKRNNDKSQLAATVRAVHGLDQVERATQLVNGRVIGRFGKFRLDSHFQPIISLMHRCPVGYEALLRSTDSANQPVSPLDVFATTGHDESDAVLLDRLCRDVHLRNFMALGDTSNWLFLNVHPRIAIQGSRYGTFFGDLLQRHGLPAHRVVIEILEGEIQEDAQLAEAVDYYKQQGCLVAIDDFGAGHSNFNRVWKIQPQIVKFDRALLGYAVGSGEVRRLLAGLVTLVHESGSLSLMEGIETEDEALIALDSGIDLAQGYYFGRPAAGLCDIGDTGSKLLALCAKSERLVRDESRHHQELLASPRAEFEQAARLFVSGMDLPHACAHLVALPKVARCYLLDATGRQVSDYVFAAGMGARRDSRFNPVSEKTDAVWARRPYFRRAMQRHNEIQVTRPYLSLPDARMCITLSVALRVEDQTIVLCCDIDWA